MIGGLTSPLAIGFIHPGIAGVAAIAGSIPIIVHLINRRRYRRVRWAAMPFLVAAQRRSARRLWIERWLLLMMRIAAIVLLGLAVARPFLSPGAALAIGASRVHRIIVLDDSGSMLTRDAGGATRYDAAQATALRFLQSFPERDPVSIVTMARPAVAVIAEPAYDRRFVRERLSAIPVTQRGTDADGALARTLDVLRASELPDANRAVYVISDFARSDWAGATAGPPTAAMTALRRLADALVDPATNLHLLFVGEDAGANVAVTRLEPDTHLIGQGVPVRLAVEVANCAARTVRNVGLQIHQDGQIVRRERIAEIGPMSSVSVGLSTEFARPGTHAVEARALPSDSDALDGDDARYLSVDVRPTTPILVVDGRPGRTLLDGQAGFLAVALAPDAIGGTDRRPSAAGAAARSISPLSARVIAAGDLANEMLSDFDVVALCNVARLPAERWAQLSAFVSQGGGLIVFAGNLVNVENYNRFAHADGDALLPGAFERAESAGPHPGAGPGGATAFDPRDLLHSVVAPFKDRPDSGLFRARVDSILPMRVDEGRADVILRYATGQAALIASNHGAGRVIVCTTSADMAWTNLAAKGDFVSLVYNMVAHVAPTHGRRRNLLVGDRIREPLGPSQVSLAMRVINPDGSSGSPSIVPDGDAFSAEFGPMEEAGLVSLSIGSASVTYAVNPDSRESQTAAVEPHALVEALGRPAVVHDGPADSTSAYAADRSTELSFVMLVVVIGVLLGESWMAAALGAPRA